MKIIKIEKPNISENLKECVEDILSKSETIKTFVITTLDDAGTIRHRLKGDVTEALLILNYIQQYLLDAEFESRNYENE